MSSFCKSIFIALVLLGLCKALEPVAATPDSMAAKVSKTVSDSAENTSLEDDSQEDDDVTHESEPPTYQYTFQNKVVPHDCRSINEPSEEVKSPPPQA